MGKSYKQNQESTNDEPIIHENATERKTFFKTGITMAEFKSICDMLEKDYAQNNIYVPDIDQC